MARIGIGNKPPTSPPDEAATDDEESAGGGVELQAAEVEEDARDDADEADQALRPDPAAPSEDNDARDLSVADPNQPTENDTNDQNSGAEATEPRTIGAGGGFGRIVIFHPLLQVHFIAEHGHRHFVLIGTTHVFGAVCKCTAFYFRHQLYRRQ